MTLSADAINVLFKFRQTNSSDWLPELEGWQPILAIVYIQKIKVKVQTLV